MNPNVYPKILDDYTQEQIETEQIRRIINLFMENDDEWERIGDIGWRAVYKKR